MSEFNQSLNGCMLHVTNTDKFKTKVISIKLRQDLDRKTTTMRSLLAMCLLGGTAKLPGMQQLSIALDQLYGASMATNVSSKGKAQIIHLTSTFVDDLYLVENEGLFEKQLSLLHDILFDPYLENGVFASAYVDLKKRELKERLQALKDDKYSYALDRTMALMGENDYLGISGVGYLEDIDAISAADLYAYFQQCLTNDTIDIYAVGHFSDEQIALFKTYFDFSKRKRSYLSCYTFQSLRASLLDVVEKQNITQSKLNLGFTCQTDFLSEDHPAMTIFNGLFGGFSHSRLFKTVREANSLCYYISSSYDAFNGIVLVSSGIEGNQADRVRELVLKELKDIQDGHVNAQELAITKRMFENSLRKSQDEAGNIIYMKYNRDLAGKVESSEAYLEKLLAVEAEDVVRVAKKMKLDTVFLLEGAGENGNL